MKLGCTALQVWRPHNPVRDVNLLQVTPYFQKFRCQMSHLHNTFTTLQQKKSRPWPYRLSSYKEENFFLFMILLDK